MISEKKDEKLLSQFHIEQKTEFEKFNCFFVDFLRYSFLENNKSSFDRY